MIRGLGILSVAIAGILQHTMAQSAKIAGQLTDQEGKPIALASVALPALKRGSVTDSLGHYQLSDVPYGNWRLKISATGFQSVDREIPVGREIILIPVTVLKRLPAMLGEVVVSGTMKEVSRLESPVPVEVYSHKFFRANPTPSIFDALQNVNGVRPQLNCSVCNTGDIHINGLEGPYTMIMIDGMPIVSGLSGVYGLSGIPQSLLERVEIVKGPASSLYGSEAVGGLINVITANPANLPAFSADVFTTSWAEVNTDLSARFDLGRKTKSLLGVNYYNYQHPVDNNKDGFTDVTLQNRISVFNKWSIERKDSRVFSFAGRYVYEDRWGGEMNWNSKYRGGEEIYGESIYTSRWELFGTYQLPVKEKIMFMFSANGHDQNSVYGNTPYLADQYIGFGQLTWNKPLKNHDLLLGATYRYTYYDDNTPATASFIDPSKNRPSHTHLPGLFVQDEIKLNKNNRLLLGARYDYNSLHGSIVTPRINYKWSSDNKNNVLRLSVGNGYRVANVFTEDHAALTGSREVVFLEDLKPETSWNGNINVVKRIYTGSGTNIGFDATAFYTYFTNKIIADYDTDPNKILYDNLKGYAVSKGISLNTDIRLMNGLKIMLGATAMEVYSREDGEKIRQLFTERFTGVWNIGYTIRPARLSVEYTGNLYGPMRLPLISRLDPRKEYSPWWSLQNIQLTYDFANGVEVYGGIKNLLNWTPNRNNPFLIARSFDPFDRNVQFDTNGQAIAGPGNPYGLTFDPAYVYAPNQGMRGFLGVRFRLY